MMTISEEKSIFYIISYYTFEDKNSFVAGLRPYRLYEFLHKKGIVVKLVTPQTYLGNEIVVSEGWFFKRMFFLKLLPPDTTIFWSIKVFFKVIWPNRKNKLVIFTSLPPNGIGLCGLLCKWFKLNCNWIIDFRDLWTDHPLYSPPITKKYIDPLIEKAFIKKAQILVCNTNWDKDFFNAKFPASNARKVVIRNGFDKITPNLSIKKSDAFKFIYAGGTTAGQATMKIIKLLEDIDSEGYIAHCDFYGEYDEEMNNSEYVTYQGVIAPEQVPTLLAKYRYGFIYLPENSEWGGRVAQKFYDYIGAGVIPVCFRPSIEMRMLMTKLNTGIVIDDIDKVKDTIERLSNADFNATEEGMLHLTRDNQFNTILREIQSLL